MFRSMRYNSLCKVLSLDEKRLVGCKDLIITFFVCKVCTKFIQKNSKFYEFANTFSMIFDLFEHVRFIFHYFLRVFISYFFQFTFLRVPS